MKWHSAVGLVVYGGLLLCIGAARDARGAGDRAGGFLHADGAALRDRDGRIVQLRGVNLGGWLEWQPWMCPLDTSKALHDLNPGHNGIDFELRRLLVKRFGTQVADDLVNAYYDAWITAKDLDNIQSLGLNAARLTLAYDTMLNDDGTWRADAFKRIDWLIENAWRRGIYTIVGLHAFLPPAANQDGSANGYWANEPQKAETVRIWAHLAEHLRGNPAVAMYDLLNEPNNSQLKGQQPPSSATVCELYDRLYKAIRKVDPDHAIAMEGTWGWQTLRDPGKAGYRNVVYSFHWYNFGAKGTADRNKATDADIKSARKVQQTWNVPVFIGEFNLFGDQDAWTYAVGAYDHAGVSWTLWAYKNKASGSNSWGLCNTIRGKTPAIPDLTKDSAEEIKAKWLAWKTSDEAFALNPMLLSALKRDGGN